MTMGVVMTWVSQAWALGRAHFGLTNSKGSRIIAERPGCAVLPALTTSPHNGGLGSFVWEKQKLAGQRDSLDSDLVECDFRYGCTQEVKQHEKCGLCSAFFRGGFIYFLFFESFLVF